MSAGYSAPQTVHAKWRLLRPHIGGVEEIHDVLTKPALCEQVLSTSWDSPLGLVAHCRELDADLFEELCRQVTEAPILREASPPAYLGLSAKTISQLYYCVRLVKELSGSLPQSVVEIGGGLGNMAKLLLELQIASEVHIIDLPEMLSVQRAFFRSADVDMAHIRLHDVLDDQATIRDLPASAGIFFSSFALTEMSAAGRSWMADHVASRCEHIYIIGQTTYYSGEDVGSHISEILSSWFEISVKPFRYDADRWPAFELFGRALRTAA